MTTTIHYWTCQHCSAANGSGRATCGTCHRPRESPQDARQAEGRVKTPPDRPKRATGQHKRLAGTYAASRRAGRAVPVGEFLESAMGNAGGEA